MAKKNNKKTFEQSVTRLEEISSLLDSEELGLEEAIKLYEEGINLSKQCTDMLKKAELKITELKKDLDSLEEDPDIFEA
jgi:exodeoxyribonuclease VII small subunit